MKTVLFVDTETDGLGTRAAPGRKAEPARLVQLATELCNEDGEQLATMSMIVKPTGFIIPERVIDIHGITNEYAARAGLPLVLVLKMFRLHCMCANLLVAHNIKFDLGVIMGEYERLGMTKDADSLDLMPKICTMEETTTYCMLPKKRGAGFKWPKLGELYEKVTGEEMEGSHSAHSDVAAMKTCFFALQEEGIIKV